MSRSKNSFESDLVETTGMSDNDVTDLSATCCSKVTHQQQPREKRGNNKQQEKAKSGINRVGLQRGVCSSWLCVSEFCPLWSIKIQMLRSMDGNWMTV